MRCFLRIVLDLCFEPSILLTVVLLFGLAHNQPHLGGGQR